MTPTFIDHYSVASACGVGRNALLSALKSDQTGLRINDFTVTPLATHIGRIAELDQTKLPAHLSHWSCRNNHLAWLALQADDFASHAARAVTRYGSARVGLALGTSTSSIGETETAYRQRDANGRLPPDQVNRPNVHNPHSLTLFVSEVLSIGGPSVTISTACSSSAKVFAVGERWLRLGLVDAVVVGGVDSLCESVLHGFNALQLVSQEPCRPFDTARDGINLGEAGGFALLTREPGAWQLLGYGESSDAHHMSSPHPQGHGAQAAIHQAFKRAKIAPEQVDYLNLHGTASPMNDRIEAQLIQRCYGPAVHASATKGWTAHALGAAGIVESAICLTAIENDFMPGSLNTTGIDPICSPQVRMTSQTGSVRTAASHSFGFGGSNCSLIFAQTSNPV